MPSNFHLNKSTTYSIYVGKRGPARPWLHREPGPHSPPFFSPPSAAHWTDARDPLSGAKGHRVSEAEPESCCCPCPRGCKTHGGAGAPQLLASPRQASSVGRRSWRGLPLDAGGQAPTALQTGSSSSLGSQTAGLLQGQRAVYLSP